MSEEQRKQMNKFETAFFKDPSKNALQVSKENELTNDEENMLSFGEKPKHLCSEISFKEK